MRKNLAISSETFLYNSEKWLKVIRYNESGLVLNFVGDHFYTIPELLRNKLLLKKLLGKYHKRYIFSYIELTSNSEIDEFRDELFNAALTRDINLHQKDTLEQLIDALVKDGYEVVFFLSRVEKPFLEKSDLLSKLEFVSRNHRVSFLYFSELNLTNPQFYEQQRDYPSMFQNIIYQEIYGIKDAAEFISYNENLWGVSLPPLLKTQIIEQCGGNLWLLRQAVRLFRNNPDFTSDQIFRSAEILTKALASWKQLFPNEQQVIEEVIVKKQKNISDITAFEYLLRIKLIEKDQLGYRLTIPLLITVSQNDINKEGFYIESGNTFYNNLNLSQTLTYKEEQLLRFFMKNSNVLVGREKIGEIVWGSKDFTVWALEKTVSKLRKKLISIGLSQDIILTKKGVGYVFTG